MRKRNIIIAAAVPVFLIGLYYNRIQEYWIKNFTSTDAANGVLWVIIFLLIILALKYKDTIRMQRNTESYYEGQNTILRAAIENLKDQNLKQMELIEFKLKENKEKPF